MLKAHDGLVQVMVNGCDWLCIYLKAHDWLVQVMVSGCDWLCIYLNAHDWLVQVMVNSDLEPLSSLLVQIRKN
jgi:hypothetical protein